MTPRAQLPPHVGTTGAQGSPRARPGTGWEMVLHQLQAALLLPAGMAGGEGEGWQLKENKPEQENQGYSLLLSPC